MELFGFNLRIEGVFLIMTLCQCTTSRYNLADYKYYTDEALAEQTTYHYNNGHLLFSTLSWFSYNDSLSSSHVCFTLYDTATHESEIDSIENSYITTIPGSVFDTIKVIKTFDSNGKKKKVVEYTRQSGDWKQTKTELYDSIGNLRYEWYGTFCSWYSYDSQNRYLGRRKELLSKDSFNQEIIDVVVDTVIYAEDSNLIIRSNVHYVNGDSIQEIKPNEIYKLNNRGLIKSLQRGSLKNVHGNSGQLIKEVYRYDLKGRLKLKVSYVAKLDQTRLKKSYKTTYQYKRGLKTRERYIDFGKRSSNYVIKYKYDFKNRLLLEQTTLDSEGKVKTRKVWTYFKAGE